MLIVSDVHGASAALRRVASMGEPLLVLGDLINYIDYRTNEGIVADVSGQELVDEFVSIRGAEGHEAAVRDMAPALGWARGGIAGAVPDRDRGRVPGRLRRTPRM